MRFFTYDSKFGPVMIALTYTALKMSKDEESRPAKMFSTRSKRVSARLPYSGLFCCPSAAF